MIRVQMSRPTRSVPHGICHIGGRSERAASVARGSCTASEGPTNASKQNAARKPAVAVVNGSRRKPSRSASANAISVAKPHAHVDYSIQNIDGDVDKDIECRNGQHETLHGGRSEEHTSE